MLVICKLMSGAHKRRLVIPIVVDIYNDSRIMLNSPITGIQYDDNGVTVILENGTERITANYGIVTFPLGVLQSDTVDFDPPLPTWKREAILSFDVVDYTPILVKWPYDFWSDTIGSVADILLIDERFGLFHS